MPTILEQKVFRYNKDKQKAAREKVKRPPTQGVCKRCRAKVTFLSNALGAVRLIFCPNCKYINAQETITQESKPADQPNQQQPTVQITGPRGV